MKRLLDTSAYVALKRGHGGVARLVRDSVALPFSIVVVGELLFGFRNGSRFDDNVADLDAFLEHPAVALELVGRATADRFGRISSSLRRAGTPIPTNDVWIAAHAMELGAELVTLDRHFDKVMGLPSVILDPD